MCHSEGALATEESPKIEDPMGILQSRAPSGLVLPQNDNTLPFGVKCEFSDGFLFVRSAWLRGILLGVMQNGTDSGS